MINEQLEIHSTRVGEKIISTLKKLECDSEIIGEVRGKGLIIGVEKVEDKASKKPAPQYAKDIRKNCHQNGLLVEIGGHYSNVVRFLPPLVITESLAMKGIQVFSDAVKKVETER